MIQYPTTISDSWKEVLPFVTNDNRFVYYILKKNGYQYLSDEFIAGVRFRYIISISRYQNNKTSFESEAMLVNYLSKAIVFAAMEQTRYQRAERRYAEIPEARIDHMEAKDHTLFANNQYINEQDGLSNEDVDVFINVVEDILGYEYSFILRSVIKGETKTDIGKAIGISAASVTTKINHIKKLYTQYVNREEKNVRDRFHLSVREHSWNTMEDERERAATLTPKARSNILSL